MTTINDIGDLVRVLQEQPQWAEALRSILLTRELLELPGQFARFVAISERFMDATAQNFEAVNRRFDGIEHDLAEFKAETSQRFDGIDQRLDRMDLRFDGIDQRFDRMDLRFDGMDQRFDRMDRRLNQMDGRMDNEFGPGYESKVEKNLSSVAGQFLNLERTKVLMGGLSGKDGDLREKADQAVRDGIISSDDFYNLTYADIIFTGFKKSDRSMVHVVVEASITAGDRDVQRALARARTMATVTGETAMPVVISANIGENQRQLAERHGVEMIHHPQ